MTVFNLFCILPSFCDDIILCEYEEIKNVIVFLKPKIKTKISVEKTISPQY